MDDYHDIPLPPEPPPEHDAPPPQTLGRPTAGSGRVPPHNLEAERSALGAILLRPEVAEDVFERAAATDYYAPQHVIIARHLLEMTVAEIPIDIITVGEHLRAAGQLDFAGGIPYLGELQDLTPSTSNAGSYADAVRDTAILRRLIKSAGEITESAYSATTPLGALEAADRLLTEVQTSSRLESVSTLDVGDFDALLANGMKPPDPDLLTRTDGQALLYLGKMHTLQAEPSQGKGWVACLSAGEVLNIGGAVAYIDYEDTAVAVFGRLLTLGIEPALIRESFRYIQPAGKLGLAELAELHRLLDDLNPDLVIIDGVAEALQRDGLNEDVAADVVAWYDKLARPLARAGAAVITIDHIVKDKEQQGRYARGSGAKLAVLDGVAYTVKMTRPFSREKSGSLQLTIAKDRSGGVGAIGDIAAVLHVEPHGNGERLTTKLEPPPKKRDGEDSTWQPTATMDRVIQTITESPVPLSAAAVRRLLPTKSKIVGQAIQQLIVDGHLIERKQGRKTILEVTGTYRPHGGAGTTDREEPADLEPDIDEPLHLPTEEELQDLLPPPLWETHPDEF